MDNAVPRDSHVQTEVKSCGNSPPSSGDSVLPQQRFFTGVVTSVTADSGMINNYVFFDMGVVLGGVKVEVEDVVYVEAERKHSKAGWTAVRWVWFHDA